MADKEFLLGNRARELLKYTKQATRVVSGDISKADVRAIITRVAELDDICDVKMVCQEVVHVLDTKDKEGFTKSTFRMYGEDMRETAKKILTDIHRANNTNFVVAYEERIHKIEEVVDGCSLLLEYNAMGFPPDYIIDRDYMGNPYPKNEQVARCGNAVCPPMAAAVARANFPEYVAKVGDTITTMAALLDMVAV